MRPAFAEKPELLAPAGGMDALRAAVAAGADAIYLGLDELNARRGAENFTRLTLGDATRFAHLHGARIYLTANVVVLPGELARALEMIDVAWSAGVDAVIVQDLGLLRVLRSELPQVRVHVSTQVNTHSSDTLRALASLGVSRVTLARETSLAEIAELTSVGHDLGVEVESFVHGAICICYSGQCLLSSMVGGRSANRGLCAQPCRLPYELVDEAGRVLGDVGAHLLSPRDLAGINVLPEFISSRVDSLKIEGRMKSPEYVALVTGVYRGALDRAASAPKDYASRAGELSVLSEAFSRGFTKAYLTEERGNEMMSYRRPNNRGVPIGRVASSSGGRATLTLDVAVDSEDTVEFWTSKGRFAQRVGPLEYSGRSHSSAPAGARVTISLEQASGQGDRVFRVRNAALTAAAERLFAEEPAIPLAFHVRVVTGQTLLVRVTDEKGREGTAEGRVVEAARTRAVTAEEIAEHVGRLGGTPFTASSWDIELSPGAGVGFSEVHAVRREALADYERSLLAAWQREAAGRITLPTLPTVRRPSALPRLVAAASSLEVATACLDAGADEAHVPAWALDPGVAVPTGLVPVVPRVCHDAEAERMLAPARGAGRAVAGTLGALWRLAGEGRDVQAHWGLNAVNAHACALLADLGASHAWLSPELSVGQVLELAATSPVPVGVAIAGRQELMVTEHCVLTAEGPCAQTCETCARRRGRRVLKDRKGYEFPVVTDPTGRTHLYNSVPLDASAAVPELIEGGVAVLRVDVETESPKAAAELVAAAVKAVRAAVAGREVPKAASKTTSGHFFRGVR